MVCPPLQKNSQSMYTSCSTNPLKENNWKFKEPFDLLEEALLKLNLEKCLHQANERNNSHAPTSHPCVATSGSVQQ